MATKKPADSKTTPSTSAAKTTRTASAKATTVKKSIREKKPTAAKTIRAKKPKTEKTAPAIVVAPIVTQEERAQLIAVAAYLRAESRGFTGGNQVEDWLFAEREIEARLASQPPA